MMLTPAAWATRATAATSALHLGQRAVDDRAAAGVAEVPELAHRDVLVLHQEVRARDQRASAEVRGVLQRQRRVDQLALELVERRRQECR